MATQELGIAELKHLFLRDWKLIVVLALAAGLVAFAAVSLLVPPSYEATARVVVKPPAEGGERQWPLAVYQSLLESDRILQITADRLIDRGVLAPGEGLVIGRNVESARVAVADREARSLGLMLALSALGPTPEIAAAVANAWAETFVDDSRSMLQGPTSQSETLLGGHLSPTRQQLEKVEAELLGIRAEFQEKEEQTSTSWDRRISAAEEALERSIADYQTETRRLMEELVASPQRQATSGPAAAETAGDIEAALLELVSVRAQLAQTPRVLTLEKAASDETLAEMLAAGERADRFDQTLTSQEANPLYDQLAVRALELESRVKRAAGPRIGEIAKLLAELERIQLERAAGLAALTRSKSLETRILRRRRSHALEDLSREQATVTAEYLRQLDQLRDLEADLIERLNDTVIARLLGEVDIVAVAAPAVPRNATESRQVALKVAVAVFLGGMLGLMVALFRSVG